MPNEISDTILLTGAGFTHNFGGFLAERMWAEIFNHPVIQESGSWRIKDMMLADFNYESIYDQIVRNPNGLGFYENDKKAIIKAVSEAYKNLDESLVAYHRSNPNKEHALMGLLKHFAGDNSTLGFFFTLNQDIFVERCYLISGKPLKLPGTDIHEIPRRAVASKWEYELSGDDFITLKQNVDETLNYNSMSPSEFNYIKLHGSYNWRSSSGSEAIVIGLDKESHISREPLLKRYFEIFREVISRPKTRLVVIGYSFRDKHVNKLIKEAIENHDLKLIVISTEGPQEFIDKFFEFDPVDKIIRESDKFPFGESIINKGLAGYYPLQLQEDTIKKIVKDLFLTKKI